MTTIKSGQDVVSFLKSQHEQIKSGFEKVLASSGTAREENFVALRRLMAVHETAEEEIVHPAAKRLLVGGDTLIAARLKEENEAKTALTELEKLGTNAAEFDTKFRKLQQAVLAHAQAEETLEFDVLADKLDPSRLERMGRAVELAESMAPTRPHAGIESAAANILVGPFVAMVDRVRDALAMHKKAAKSEARPRA